MQGLLAPDPSILRMSAKYPTDPVDAHANPTHTTSPNIVVNPGSVVDWWRWDTPELQIRCVRAGNRACGGCAVRTAPSARLGLGLVEGPTAER